MLMLRIKISRSLNQWTKVILRTLDVKYVTIPLKVTKFIWTNVTMKDVKIFSAKIASIETTIKWELKQKTVIILNVKAALKIKYV